MSYNYDKAHEISEDGLILENGVHLISGNASPYNLINAINASIYLQTNGAIWTHSGVGGITGWSSFSSGTSDHENLTGLLGGALNDHYHLTASERTTLLNLAYNIDGGNAATNYGATAPINGGGA